MQIEAGLVGIVQIAGLAEAADGHQLGRVVDDPAAQAARDLVTIDIRQPDIDQRHVRTPFKRQPHRFLARGGEVAVLEGDWEPSRLVVIEFEDLAAAKRFYASEAYQAAKDLREGAARMRMVAVQGVG